MPHQRWRQPDLSSQRFGLAWALLLLLLVLLLRLLVLLLLLLVVAAPLLVMQLVELTFLLKVR